MNRAPTRRLLLTLALACNTGGGGALFQGGDYQVGSISFHVASGAAVSSGGLALYLSDQPDACLALSFVPVQRATMLRLKLSAAADGTTHATVVAKSAPAAGEATGSLSQATGGVAGPHYDAASGSVAWTTNTDGSVTITSLDVGFAGVEGRITTAAALTLPACSP